MSSNAAGRCTFRLLLLLRPVQLWADVVRNGTARVRQYGRAHRGDSMVDRHGNRHAMHHLTRVTVVPVVVQRGLHLDLRTDLGTRVVLVHLHVLAVQL